MPHTADHATDLTERDGRSELETGAGTRGYRLDRHFGEEARLAGSAKRIIRATYDRVPALRPLMRKVNDYRHPPWFSGWGMTTHHAPPWDDRHDWGHFRHALDQVASTFEHGLEAETGVTAKTLDTLRWRHWIAAWTTRYAVSYCSDSTVALVECGVGDGLTAYFACNEAANLKADYTMHLYDAWSPMREAGEVLPKGGYGTASMERTKRNLGPFADRIFWHPGFVPESFDVSPEGPRAVSYLSIDLNSADPTIAALDHFLPVMTDRAVVLFDDYGHRAFAETRAAIDAYVAGRPGALFKLPTGQAILFR